MIVGLIEHRPRVECSIVALLELDGVGAALLGGAEHFLRRLELSLMVVTDLGDYEAIAIIADRVRSDCQFSGHIQYLRVVAPVRDARRE
jgi:hypothetical protein